MWSAPCSHNQLSYIFDSLRFDCASMKKYLSSGFLFVSLGLNVLVRQSG